jgi:antitoxin component YwqK of YwqJK toxin-antitoxin module
MNTIKIHLVVILNFFILNNAISQTVFPQAKECKNETDKKGNRKGDWLIGYKNYDWSSSKTHVIIDVNHLQEIIVVDAEGTKNINFLENVRYKDGIKNGLGYYYVYNREEKSTNPLAIVNYSEGKIDGQVMYFNKFNDQNPFAKVNYVNGILADQTIDKTPSIITAYQAIIDHGHIAIREYEKISSGKSVECQYLIHNASFRNSEYFALQLANKKLSKWSNKSALYKEVTDDKLNKTIICIPFAQDQPQNIATQYQQKVRVDSSGKIVNYGRVSVFQTKDPQNHITSSGKYATGVDTKYMDVYRNEDLIRKHMGQLPWTYFEGINTEKSCLIYRAELDQFDGKLEGEVKTYYFNEEFSPTVSNSEKLHKTTGQYSSEILNGSYKIYYPDKSLAAEMNFKEGKLDGRFTSIYNPSYNFIYVPNFPKNDNQQLYNFDTDKGSWQERDQNSINFVEIPYVRTSVDLFSELGKITNCNHSKPSTYKEITYACDFKENKISSDIVYFFNDKNIIFRQGVDLSSFSDKDWTYYNTDGSVCLTQAQAVAMYNAKKEQERAELQKRQKVSNNNNDNNPSQSSNRKSIANAFETGSGAFRFVKIVYDNSSNYPKEIGICSSCEFVGFNSNYIVMLDKSFGVIAKIYDVNGNDTGHNVSVCSSCEFKSVGPSSIIIYDNGITKRFDFNGNYIGN